MKEIKILFITFLVIFLFSFIFATEWADNLNNGLVSYYNFEDNVKDSAGENHGTNYGANFIEGKISKALSFDGIDDYVRINDDDSLDLNEFTLSLWFKADSQHEGYILNKGYNAFWPSDENISYRIYVTDPHITGDLWTENGRVFSRSDWIKNQWNHVVFVYDGQNSILYLNEKQVDIQSQTGNVIVNNFDLIFGGRLYMGNSGTYYNGLIDEIGIWNRALTQDEVKKLWNDGDGITYDSCNKILDSKPGKSNGLYKKGCNKGIINIFFNKIGWAKIPNK